MNPDEIIERMKALDPSEPSFYGPQDEVHIATVERLLGVRLPPSYRSFLTTYGGGDGFTGLYGNSPDRLDKGCIVGDNQLYREQLNLPQHYVLIEISPFGEIYCLDTNAADEHAENPVVMFPVDKQRRLLPPKVVAHSFADYFREELLARLGVLREELGDE